MMTLLNLALLLDTKLNLTRFLSWLVLPFLSSLQFIFVAIDCISVKVVGMMVGSVSSNLHEHDIIIECSLVIVKLLFGIVRG